MSQWVTGQWWAVCPLATQVSRPARSSLLLPGPPCGIGTLGSPVVGQEAASRAVASQGSRRAASWAEVQGQAPSLAPAGTGQQPELGHLGTRVHSCCGTEVAPTYWQALYKNTRRSPCSPGFSERTLDALRHLHAHQQLFFSIPPGRTSPPNIPTLNTKEAKHAGFPPGPHCCLMTFLIISEPEGSFPSFRHGKAVPCSLLDKKGSAE